jgi:hypothetical protein
MSEQFYEVGERLPAADTTIPAGRVPQEPATLIVHSFATGETR